MTCEGMGALVSEYLDRNIDSATRAAMEYHLNGCPSCNDLILSVTRTIALCSSLPPIAPSHSLIENIIQIATPKKRPLFKRINLPTILRPIFSPQFGMALVLVAFSVSFISNFVNPSTIGLAYSEISRSSEQAIRKADFFSHTMFSRFMKLNNRKKQLQAELQFYATSLWNKIDYQWNQFDDPSKNRQKEQKDKKEDQIKGMKSSMDLITA